MTSKHKLWIHRMRLIAIVEHGIRTGITRDNIPVPAGWARERACNIVQGILGMIEELEAEECDDG
jgi:hypothetical protein